MASVEESTKSGHEILHHEIRLWLELLQQIEQEAKETKDISRLKKLTKALKLARNSWNNDMDNCVAQYKPSMPVVLDEESEPIPSFYPSGNGKPVKVLPANSPYPKPNIIIEE